MKKIILKNKGFTLLELMVVVAIVGVLSVVALPAYNSYLIRAQIEESLILSAGAKPVVISYFAEVGDYPADNTAASYQSPSGKYVEQVTIDAGVIVAKLGNKANLAITGSTVRLTPIEQAGGNLRWYCSSSAPSKYLPGSCKETVPVR